MMREALVFRLSDDCPYGGLGKYVVAVGVRTIPEGRALLAKSLGITGAMVRSLYWVSKAKVFVGQRGME